MPIINKVTAIVATRVFKAIVFETKVFEVFEVFETKVFDKRVVETRDFNAEVGLILLTNIFDGYPGII